MTGLPRRSNWLTYRCVNVAMKVISMTIPTTASVPASEARRSCWFWNCQPLTCRSSSHQANKLRRLLGHFVPIIGISRSLWHGTKDSSLSLHVRRRRSWRE